MAERSTIAGSEPAPELTPLRRALLALQQMRDKLAIFERRESEPIAVVGIGCRYPGGVVDTASFWQLLRGGLDAVTEVPPDRWDADAFHDPDPNAPGKSVSRWGGFIPGVDRFDAQFFGISPREAASMDPQQRLLLQVAWEALEHAGLPPAGLRATKTGVFVGISTTDYAQLQLRSADAALDVHSGTGNALSVAAGRISYTFGFEGPAVSLDTACSSSLVAVHLACQSLRSGESDLALAGGVNLMLSPLPTVAMSKLGALSPDGRCRTLDAAANGYVRSEGCGVLVLKRVSRAVAAGDRVLAVIRGSAVNQDGRSSGLTVPNGRAQEAVLREAYARAGVDPAQAAYVEAHGTGTLLGDPIEMEALGKVLGPGRSADAPFFVGSVKTNFGHAESAAGVAGMIKVILSLRHREIPPNLHFRQLNPHISSAIPFRVPTAPTPWPSTGPRLVGGVSSFGFSGTNAHVVIEEAPPEAPAAPPAGAGGQAQVLPLSAKDDDVLRRLAASYESMLAGGTAGLDDLVFSASTRRTHHPRRVAVVGRTADELRAGLAAFVSGEPSPAVKSGVVSARGAKTVFVFPGQGSQWSGMGRHLLAAHPAFADAIAACDESIRRHGGVSPRQLLEAGVPEPMLKRVDVVQPLLFCMQVGLAALWRAWGIEPDAVVGHSMGEIAAAQVAGALSLDDAAKIITLRSRIVSRASGRGAMVVAEIGMARAEQLLAGAGDQVSVAASNAADSVILSGDPRALGAIVERLQREEVFCRYVDVDYASHCPQMDEFLPELVRALGTVSPLANTVRMISTVTAKPIQAAEMDAAYWGRNLRSPVLFHEAMQLLFRERHDTFLEISPHPVLAHVVDRALRQSADQGEAIPSLRRDQEPETALKSAAAALHVRGVALNWGALAAPGRLVDLPITPWRAERFWLEEGPARTKARAKTGHPLLGDAWVSSDEGRARFFQTEIDLESLEYLAHHLVNGRVVLPAAAYFEIALAAGRQVAGGQVRLADTELQAILQLEPGQAKTVQLVLVPEGRGWSFRLASLDASGDWTLHATGTLQADDGAARAPLAADEIRGRCAETFSGDELYQRMEEAGISYGAPFRGVQRGWRRDGESLTEIQAPESVARQCGSYQFHPALFDAALQSLAAAGSSQGATFLPVGAASIRVLAPAEPKLVCHGVLAPVPIGTDVLSGDVVLARPDGTPVLEVRGLRVRRVGRSEGTFADWLYGIDWVESTREPSAKGAPVAGGRWLLGGGGPTRNRVAQLLESAGDRCRPFASADELQRALKEAVAAQTEIRGVVCLDALDEDHAELAPGAAPPACQSLLAAAQAVVKAGFRTAPRLFAATRATQPVNGGDQGGPDEAEAGRRLLAGAPLWGFIRSLAHEHPELRPTAVDVSATPDDDELRRLADELRADSAESQVALRGPRRYVARLTRRRGGEAARVAPDGRPFGLDLVRPGTFEGLELHERPRTPPGPGEVEIEVHAAGLNFLDVLMSLGVLPNDAATGSRLGGECAGVVAAVGAGVDGLKVGDQVIGVGPSCFASYVTLRSALVVPKPPSLSMEQAATLAVTFLTAHISLLQIGRLAKGERVLIHAAAGGVGLAAVQIAQQAGAEIFATAGSEDKRAYLRSLGVAHVMDSRSLDFAEQVRAATANQGIDVVLNSLAGAFIPSSFDLLRDYGRFVEIGKRDYYENKRLGLRPFLKNLSFSLVNLRAMLDQRPAEVQATLREITRLIEAGQLRPLPMHVFGVSEAADAFRFMAQAKHTGKVVVSMKDPAARIARSKSEPLACRLDATFLITGGLGGLGLEVAKWLVARGARHLVLLGRGAPSEAAHQTIAALAAEGAEVTVEGADVARSAELARVLSSIARTGHPLRGVVHAAGVLDDGVIIEQTPERLGKVLAPKVHGAWNLHQLTRQQDLDFFVMFSSAASVFGAPAQAGYAAGNAFLDSLAHHRRRRGLVALSINWGAWAEVGLAAARANRGPRLATQGMRSLTPAEGIAALDHLQGTDAVQATVVPIQARHFRQANRRSAESPFFAYFRETAASGGESGTAVKELAAAAPAQRRRLLEALLKREVAQVLRIAPARIDAATAFGDFGFDSLLAIELRNRLETSLGIALPTSLLWSHRTIEALAPELAARLGLELESDAAPLESAPPEANPPGDAAPLDDMSADELAAELARELGAADRGASK